MLNLAISLGLATVLFGIVAAIFGSIVAGVIPAVFVVFGALYFLGRRTSRAVEEEIKAIVPLLENRQIEPARQTLRSIKERYGRWQFGLEGQIDAQLGILEYIQFKWDRALPLLESGKFQNWTAHMMIGCIHYRKGSKPQAWESFSRAARTSRKETIIYLVWATLLERSNDRTKALEVLNQGLEAQPDSNKLKELKKRIANKKKIQTKTFGEQWFQFFPEDAAKQMIARGPQAGMVPQPRIGARGAPRR